MAKSLRAGSASWMWLDMDGCMAGGEEAGGVARLSAHGSESAGYGEAWRGSCLLGELELSLMSASAASWVACCATSGCGASVMSVGA